MVVEGVKCAGKVLSLKGFGRMKGWWKGKRRGWGVIFEGDRDDERVAGVIFEGVREDERVAGVIFGGEGGTRREAKEGRNGRCRVPNRAERVLETAIGGCFLGQKAGWRWQLGDAFPGKKRVGGWLLGVVRTEKRDANGVKSGIWRGGGEKINFLSFFLEGVVSK